MFDEDLRRRLNARIAAQMLNKRGYTRLAQECGLSVAAIVHFTGGGWLLDEQRARIAPMLGRWP